MSDAYLPPCRGHSDRRGTLHRRLSPVRWAAIVFLTFCSCGCVTSARSDWPGSAPGLLLSNNLSEIKEALIAYHDNGQYERDLERIDDAAAAYVVERAGKVLHPALVLDIDETALSNWERMLANDFSYFPSGPCEALPKGPCGGPAYHALARSPAIAPTLGLAQIAQKHHVAIFFITGRYETERTATERNLHAVGYPEWIELFMRPDGTTTPSAADYKLPCRERIEQMGYTIIANVGDQPSDLAGAHAERVFLLPDPFYRIP